MSKGFRFIRDRNAQARAALTLVALASAVGCGNPIDSAKVLRRNALGIQPPIGDLGSEGGARINSSQSYDVHNATVGGSVKRGRLGISPSFRVTGGIHVGSK